MLSNLRSGGVSLTCFVPVACRPFTQDSVFSFFGWGPRLPSDVCYLSVISQRQDSFEFTCLGVHVSAPWRCHGSWRRSTSSSETFPIKAGLSFYGGFEEIFKTIDVGYHFFIILFNILLSHHCHYILSFHYKNRRMCWLMGDILPLFNWQWWWFLWCFLEFRSQVRSWIRFHVKIIEGICPGKPNEDYFEVHHNISTLKQAAAELLIWWISLMRSLPRLGKFQNAESQSQMRFNPEQKGIDG